MRDFGSLLRQKKGFLISVYATLIAQLAFTFSIMGTPWVKKLSERPWIVILAMLALAAIQFFVHPPALVSLILFAAWSVCTSALLRRATDATPEGTIKLSILGAIVIFVVLGLVGAYTASVGVDLSPWAPYLFAVTLGVAVAALLAWALKIKSNASRVFAAVILVLFSLWVVFDTNEILQRDYSGNFVDAAFGFYIDWIELFTSLMELYGD